MNKYLFDINDITHPSLTSTIKELCQQKNQFVLTSTMLDVLSHSVEEKHSNADVILKMAVEEVPDLFEIRVEPSLNETFQNDTLIHYCMKEENFGIITSNTILALKAKAYHLPIIFLEQREEELYPKITSPNSKVDEIPADEKEIPTTYEIATLPHATFIEKSRELRIKTGSFRDNVTIVFIYGNQNDVVEMNVIASLHIGDVVLIVEKEGTSYSLSEYTITKISKENNCLKKHLAEGHNGKKEFDSTGNDKYDEILSTIL